MKVRYYMWLIDMSVMLPSVKRDVRNVDNNDGCNSQSAEEFSDYSDFSHISRRSKDTKKDVSLCRRRLHSVVQRKASIDSNSRGEYAENYSRSSDQKPSNLNFRSRARQREKQYRRTRHDNSFSGDNESMQSDDDRDHLLIVWIRRVAESIVLQLFDQKLSVSLHLTNPVELMNGLQIFLLLRTVIFRI